MRFRLSIVVALACFAWLGWTIAQKPAKKRDYDAEIDSILKDKKFDEKLFILDTMEQSARLSQNWSALAAYAANRAEVLKGEEKYDEALRRLDSTLVILRKAGLGESEFAAKLWVWKALEYRMKQEWINTRNAYQTAIRLYEKNKSLDSFLAYAYKNLAQLEQRLSENRQSLRYLQQALRVDTAHSYYASFCNNLANAYIFIDSLERAEYYYHLGREALVNAPEARISNANTGAELARRQSDLKTAETLGKEALLAARKDKEEIDNVIRSLSLLADITGKQGNSALANNYYREAEALGKANYSTKSREMTKLYVEIGQYYQNRGLWQTALDYFQQALIQIFPDFNDIDPATNPTLDKAFQESQAMEASAGKAMVLLQHPGVSVQDRLNAAACFDLSFEIAAKLRQTYHDDVDKIQLAAQYRVNLRTAALNLVQCYALTNNKSILNRLFVLFEQSKAQALRDAVRQQQIFSALPEMVTNQLTGIRQELGAIRSDLLDIQLVGAKKDTTKLNLLLKREFELTTSYTDKLDSLQKQYPWLAQLLQTESTPNISNTLANLSDTTAILSWFDAGDHYLSIVVRRNGLSLVDLPVDSVFRRQLSDFIALLPDRERQESRPNEYFSAAYALYNKLWPEQILNGIRKVVIVPDGALCHLPFEALITAGWSGRFGEAPYLLNRYDVSYNWSAVWPVSTTPVGDRLLFAAPFEREGHDKLPALVKSGEEKPEGIVMHNLEGPEATAAAFLKEAPAYGVLHLATHAHADSTAAPGIEFFDKTLTIPEISGQRFNASLVSLSACETGAGRYAQGEGVLSLAYAFAYAGAQSLAASQWAVNELSTASLFTQFYKHLKNGVSKSAALRQSKLDYLHSSGLDTRKAPYFWAAFTLTGTDGAIVLKSDYSRWMWSSLVALMLVAGFGYGIRRRKNA